MVRIRTFIIYLIICIGVTGYTTAYVMTELKLKPCKIAMRQYKEKLKMMENENRILTEKSHPAQTPVVSDMNKPAPQSKPIPSPMGKAYAKQSLTQKQHPTISRGCADIGRGPLNRGEYPRAITLYSDAITKNPDDRLCHRWLGDAYFGLGDKQRAVIEWKEAAKLGDKTIQSYLDYLKLD
jgi:tetratricopeptide (TPR) repeat protein